MTETQTAEISAVIERVRGLEASGLLLAAHDLARATLEAGVDDDRLRYRALVNLARCGATSVALDLFNEWQLHSNPNPEIGAVYAHLLKDVALHHGKANAAQPAAGAYTALWRETGKPWLGVNAAAMALLAGDRRRCGAMAAALGEVPDRRTYWSAATAAEAALLRGDAEAAHRWLSIAETRAGKDLNLRAITRRQLRWEARLLDVDPALLEALSIPDVLHYTGDTPTARVDEAQAASAIDAAVRGTGFGFGGLAAGGEIMIAEALLRHGAQLHVILPCPPALFEQRRVTPYGQHWRQRFQACLEQARVNVLEPKPHDDWSLTLASRRAMGLARLQARQLDARARQIALWDGTPPQAANGTAVDIEAWRAAGAGTDIIAPPWPKRARGRPAPRPPRQPLAVLFGDLPGFGRLDETGLANFYQHAMAAVAEAIGKEQTEYRNAWGDAVQCVFAHPNAAARCALGIRAALHPDALTRRGLPRSLTPRLALDHGALLPVHDPVQRVAKFAGTVMTRAARIEPVTPPGRIYATEAFACEMALEPFPAVTCDYAGYTRTAKDYGILPLYSVRQVGRLAVKPG